MPNENDVIEDYQVSILVRKHEGKDGRAFFAATARACDFKKPAFPPMFAGLEYEEDGLTVEQSKARFRFKITMKSGCVLPSEEGFYTAQFKGSCWIDKRPGTTYPTIWANCVPATWTTVKTGEAPALPKSVAK